MTRTSRVQFVLKDDVQMGCLVHNYPIKYPLATQGVGGRGTERQGGVVHVCAPGRNLHPAQKSTPLHFPRKSHPSSFRPSQLLCGALRPRHSSSQIATLTQASVRYISPYPSIVAQVNRCSTFALRLLTLHVCLGEQHGRHVYTRCQQMRKPLCGGLRRQSSHKRGGKRGLRVRTLHPKP